MKRLMMLTLITLGTCSYLVAEERIDLTAPYDPDTRSTTQLRVNELRLRWGNTSAESHIYVELSSGTIHTSFTYIGQDARDQMVLLNKANLTSNSLHKRIINKLISDGKISGTVSGTPD